MALFAEAETLRLGAAPFDIVARRLGAGPPVLLLHGFPETHLMWRDIAPRLAARFTLICPDLPGYGQSGCPPTDRAHAPYSKRTMAAALVSAMSDIGYQSFSVAGHDRGGRVAYRMTLDHPDRIERLAVLDIVPTLDTWEAADARFALAFWPWSLLAQPAPLPERLIAADPAAIIDAALSGWGSPPSSFGADIRDAYIAALSAPNHIHAIAEEYRAAAGIDREHDRADRQAGRRIGAPLLALWSQSGALAEWYEPDGGPLGIWRRWADQVAGRAVPGGHFFPEEHPAATAAALADFFAAA